jgi:PAS domain S-box-containing protein
MRGIIDNWERADQLVDLLDARAEQIRVAGEAGHGAAQTSALLADIEAISERITPLNTKFSAQLGDVARTTTVIIVGLNLALGASLLPLGLMLSRRMVKHSYETEDALRTSEERFQLAVAGSNDGLWDWDLVGGELYLSPRCRELMGFAEGGDLPAARGFLRLVRPAHRRDLMRVLRGHLHWRQAFDVEVPVRSGDADRWFRLRGESVRDSSGVSVRMAGSLSDVTDRKSAEEQLYAEKERAQVTLQSIGDAVITTDTGGAVQYLNPVAEALLGKGVPVGTVLAFMMAVIALSLPEMLILRKVVKWPLLGIFAAYLAVSFILVGVLFNSLRSIL